MPVNKLWFSHHRCCQLWMDLWSTFLATCQLQWLIDIYATYISCFHILLLFCHAPLGVRSTKSRHQSPEWTILSHVNCFKSFSHFRYCWIVFIHTVRVRVWGGLLQISKGFTLANIKYLLIYTAVVYDLTVASNWLLDLLNQLLGTFCCHFCSQITVKRRWSSTLAAAVQQTSLCSTSQWYCQSLQHYPALLYHSVKKFSFCKLFSW